MLQAIAFEKLLQNEGVGICEVGITTANLIEFVAGLLDGFQLLIHLGGVLCAADTHTSYILAYKFTLSPLVLFSFLFTALFVLFKTPIYANYSNTPNNRPSSNKKLPPCTQGAGRESINHLRRQETTHHTTQKRRLYLSEISLIWSIISCVVRRVLERVRTPKMVPRIRPTYRPIWSATLPSV